MEKEIKITLHENEVSQVLNALSTFPYREVFRVVHKIQQQIQPQLEELKAAQASDETLPGKPFLKK